MALLFHIIIALCSLGWATFVCILPSARRLQLNYLLIALTVASGSYLVVSLHAALLSSCLTGLVYLSVVSAGIFIAKQKLVKITT
jgi:hypothetical protein